jgi:4-hydroxy-3-methylbut-2-enyl diphosphate reductase
MRAHQCGCLAAVLLAAVQQQRSVAAFSPVTKLVDPASLVKSGYSTRFHHRRRTVPSAAAGADEGKVTTAPPAKRKFIKDERNAIAKKKTFLRGAGVFKDVKKSVEDDMAEQFSSELVGDMKETPNYVMEKDGFEFHLAKDFGFCWGVERSINLAYSAVETFPDANFHITNELIHNPTVNQNLKDKNVNFIAKDDDNNKDFSQIAEGDIVMLPAFGATLDEMKELDEKGVRVVDTTCPWVAKVWTTVHTHQVRGLTSIIHGKYAHEETMATKSMCETYLCVKNEKEAKLVVDFMLLMAELEKEGTPDSEAALDAAAAELMATFKIAASSHFDPRKHLKKVGLANQTTMYKKETRAIGQMFQKAMMTIVGPDKINDHYYEFDTICDATQVRQDAVDALCDTHEKNGLDFILVVGGWDSSNTAHLLEIPQMRGVPSYHINEAECITADNKISHRTMEGDIRTDDLLPDVRAHLKKYFEGTNEKTNKL